MAVSGGNKPALSVAVGTGSMLVAGASGCVAGGLAGPAGVLVGCGIGAAAGVVAGVIHYLVDGQAG